MFRAKSGLAAGIVWMMAGVTVAQEKLVAPQTARQAIIEMFTGGPENFNKHLTAEVRTKLSDSTRHPPEISNLISWLDFAGNRNGGPEFKSFESGPVLFSIYNPQLAEKLEVRIDREDRRPNTEQLELSLHSFRNLKEQNLPVGLRLLLELRLQQMIWRLDAITVSARIPVENLYDTPVWNGPAERPRVPGQPAASVVAAARPNASPPLPKVEPTKQGTPAPPDNSVSHSATQGSRTAIIRALQLIGIAEDIYSRRNPGMGFTCKVKDLVNIGMGMEDSGRYSFIDPEFAGGVSNGYRFTLAGCEGQPVAAFQVTAEPISGSGNAYCSDASHRIRISSDGLGATCLVSGKATRH